MILYPAVAPQYSKSLLNHLFTLIKTNKLDVIKADVHTVANGPGKILWVMHTFGMIKLWDNLAGLFMHFAHMNMFQV